MHFIRRRRKEYGCCKEPAENPLGEAWDLAALALLNYFVNRTKGEKYY